MQGLHLPTLPPGTWIDFDVDVSFEIDDAQARGAARFLGNRQSSKRCIFEALFRGIVMLYFFMFALLVGFFVFFFSSLSGWLVGCLMSVAELCCFCCGYCCCHFLLLLLLPVFFLFLLLSDLSVSLVFALVVHFCLCFATLG